MSTWVVRAGPNGISVRDALKYGCSFIGWGEVGRLSTKKNKLDIEKLIQKKNPLRDPGVVAREANQIYSFIHEIQIGDTCIMPIQLNRIAIGKFTGNYQFQNKDSVFLCHKRPVYWVFKSIPRVEIPKRIRNRFRDRRTVFQLKSDNAGQTNFDHAELILTGYRCI